MLVVVSNKRDSLVAVRHLSAVSTAALVFSLVVLAGLFLAFQKRDSLDRAEAATRDIALVLEEYAKRTFETSDLLLARIAAYTLQHGGPAELVHSEDAHRFLVGLSTQSSSGDFFLIVSREGVPVAVTSPHPPPAISFADQAWFRRHQEGAQRVVGHALVGRITGELLFTYSHRLVTTDGHFDGAVQVAIRPTFLQAFAQREVRNTSDPLEVSLWNLDGETVARSGFTAANLGETVADRPNFQAARHATPGKLSGSYQGASISFWRRLEKWPVVVEAAMSREAALANWRGSLLWTAVLLFSAVSLGSVASIMLVRLSKQEDLTRATLADLNGELLRSNDRLGVALAEKSVLLQEVHHRIRNNLATTAALLSAQMRVFNDPDVRLAFKQTQDRLRSIAMIHEVLYKTDTIGSVRLPEYVDRLLSEIARTHGAEERGISVECSVEPIELDQKTIVPVALMLTELVTNAFKHAFPNGERGHIFVGAHRTGASLRLEVTDDGRGGAVVSSTKSLGSELIKRFAAQLGAVISYDGSKGQKVSIEIPFSANSGSAEVGLAFAG